VHDRPFGGTRLKAAPLRADVTVEVKTLSMGPESRTPEGVARDSGDVILSWLTRIVLGLSIVAVVGFDGLSIGVAHVSAADDANSAALAGSVAWRASHGDLTATLQAAEGSAALHGEVVLPTSLRVTTDGTVYLRLQHDATTLVVHRIGPIKSWATVVVNGSGRSDPPS
jgi:hypothetical protein